MTFPQSFGKQKNVSSLTQAALKWKTYAKILTNTDVISRELMFFIILEFLNSTNSLGFSSFEPWLQPHNIGL